MRARFVTVLLAAFFLCSGCGYQFTVDGAGPTVGGAPNSKPLLSGPAPKLAIPLFVNSSLEPNIEIKYTNYVRREFASGSGAQVVTSEAPDLILKGQITQVVLPALAFTQSATLESRVTATLKVTVDDLRTGKTIWTEQATASSEFFVTNDLQFNRVLQTRALEQAGQYLAQDLATRFLHHLEATNQGATPSAPTTTVLPKPRTSGTAPTPSTPPGTQR